MKILVISLLFMCMILTGCSNVSAPYLVKKDRVDQEEVGNRGYLLGTPPSTPFEKKFTERTLVNIDVEIPILPGEKGYKTSSYTGRVIREEDIKMEPKVK